MRFLVVVLSVSFLHATADAQEWTRFRGPNGSGVSDATTVPVEWTDDDYNWVTDLPGRGHSSPVILDNRIFLTSSSEDTASRQLLCLDTATGKIVWQKDFPFDAYKKHKNNSFASSTVCVDSDHVYVVWQSRTGSPLMAFDHEGNGKWTYDLGPYLHGQGGATSPIVHEDMVILTNDQKEPSFLLAVDRITGKERWKIPREGKRACYSTPCVFKPDGRPPELIFTHCYEGVIGVNPKTGQRTWHIDVFGRSSQRALGSPVVADDLIIATSGAVGGDRQLVAVRPSGETTATEAWRSVKQTPHVPTPLVYKDWLFLVSDQGIASCLKKDTGDTVWKQRLNGNYFGSPVCVDGRIYCIDLDGNVPVFSASEKYELYGRNALGEGSKSTPAVSGGVMYLRTESRLFSLGGQK